LQLPTRDFACLKLATLLFESNCQITNFEHLKLETLLLESNVTGGNTRIETGHLSSKCCILLEGIEKYHRLSGKVFHGNRASGANANGLTLPPQR
jgi:hypothetical protein